MTLPGGSWKDLLLEPDILIHIHQEADSLK